MGFLQCVRATFVTHRGDDSAPQVDSFLVSPMLSSRIPRAGESLCPIGEELFGLFMKRLGLSAAFLADTADPKNCPSVPSEWVVKRFDTSGNPVYYSSSEGVSLEKSREMSKKPGFGPTITNHHDL